MKRTLLFVLTLSGLSFVSSNIIKEYHYVSDSKTWADAQSYCRENFDDLATINNEDENVKLMSVSQSTGRYVWIGLYDNFEAWKWALGDTDFNNGFSYWETDEPNNKHTTEGCTVMTTAGRWQDYRCWMTVLSVCYNEPGPTKYILVETLMTWHEAMAYCRSKYTDLASVRNLSENNQISSLLSGNTWIGLHRKTWPYCSDKSPNIFTKWATDNPVSTTRTQLSCASHEARFKLKFQSEADLNDPAVQQQILEQLHAKLEKHGVADFKLRWTQTDGLTFHKEKKTKEVEGAKGKVMLELQELEVTAGDFARLNLSQVIKLSEAEQRDMTVIPNGSYNLHLKTVKRRRGRDWHLGLF
ncbi:E-selectin [Dissostichus eleginoides]|uniref:E-selectin n=1 Tax=Dissostichus eleginoides TaxID=100907 RepID=A0AAD9BCY2_DISEL|nr:E-selectin [Dissostichus eleginoides]